MHASSAGALRNILGSGLCKRLNKNRARTQGHCILGISVNTTLFVVIIWFDILVFICVYVLSFYMYLDKYNICSMHITFFHK